jgi:hypothetical protein
MYRLFCPTGRIKLWLLPLVAIYLVSCVFPQRYPSTWAPVEEYEPPTCASISGRYRDLGTNIRNVDYWLSDKLFWLTAARHSPSPHGTYVEITQPDDATLQVTVWKRFISEHSERYEPVLKKTLSADQGHFRCTEDGVTLRDINWAGGFPGVTETVIRTFQRSKDGSLIMKDEGGLVGWHVFLPIFLGGTNWVRWEPWKAGLDFGEGSP